MQTPNDLPGQGLVAVLAAGLASRFGGGKLDAACGGQPLGQHALATALGLGWPVVVMAGPARPRFLDRWAPGAFAVIENPAPEAGMGGSVALAARTAQAQGAELLLVVLADMPLVSPATLAALRQRATRHGLAATVWPDGRRGVPACFAPCHFAALSGLTGDAGARDLLRSCPAEALVAPRPAELLDVDLPADLASVAAHLAAEQRA